MVLERKGLSSTLSFGKLPVHKPIQAPKDEELQDMSPEDLKKKLAQNTTDDSTPATVVNGVEIHLKDRAITTAEDEEDDKRERMRVEVLNEIIISERYYVRDLETVITVRAYFV
jgi:hypothetical protein